MAKETIVFITLTLATLVFAKNHYRICYYPYAGNNEGQLTPDKLNLTLCTHILFSFANIVNNTLIPRHGRDIEGYGLVTALKKEAPNLRIILSAGSYGNLEFSKMAGSEWNRKHFINQSINYLRKYNFDGLDLDWEFPEFSPNGAIGDREVYPLFLREMKYACKQEAKVTGKERLTLSIAVPPTEPMISVSYDVPKMVQSLDFISVMCYDYHVYGYYSPFVAHNSPLDRKPSEKGYLAMINLKWSSNWWAKASGSKDKIVIGVPTYGHTYKLLNPRKNKLYSPAVGISYGQSEISYGTICKILASGATKVFDKEARVPYLFSGTNWVSYDDVNSIREKAEWIKNNGFAGIMTWSLMDDDWQGVCSEKSKFPLHSVINEVFSN